MHLGPHLLGPTGGDLNRYNKVGTIFAGWHTDLNFLTIHGKSNYPGLSVWKRDGNKMAVKVPAGCLLLQAGQQFEYLTAGHVKAGFHEVVLTDKAAAAAQVSRARHFTSKTQSIICSVYTCDFFVGESMETITDTDWGLLLL